MVNFILLILIYTVIYSFMALGQNVITGYGGMLSLCQAGFFAIGSYTTGILTVKCGWGFWPTMFVGMFIAIVLGILIGIPTLRLKGDYLAIVTLGVGEIIKNVINNWISLTNGPMGIQRIPMVKVFGFKVNPYNNKFGFLLLSLCILLLCALFLHRFIRTRNGRALEAVREDELASLSSGINSTVYKVMAFAIGACLASIGGSLYSVLTLSISPGTYTFMMSVMVLCMVVLGGMGNLLGVILGAFIIQLISYLPELTGLSRVIPPQCKEILFGVILVVMMIFRPEGLLGRPKRQTNFMSDSKGTVLLYKAKHVCSNISSLFSNIKKGKGGKA
ncbi:MAG: branched-chain amino acid ABC transporter permease [Spirochaetales bacterium]|nr:branched-chain amino acid ABC transporter permease [Spirochaetales bacterium]